MDYCPNTDKEINEMLSSINAESIEDLFEDISKKIRTESFNLPEGKSEFEVFNTLHKLSVKNKTDITCFLGAGMYDHFIPAVVDALSSRAEFSTAYTPYQPECSQGTLQALFEYQTAICRLTGMEASNASLYDGGTALAEAALMSIRITERKRVLVAGGVNPFYQEVLKTYLQNRNIEIVKIVSPSDIIDRKILSPLLDDQTACIILQNPNFFGSIDDYRDIVEMAYAENILVIESVYPIALGLIHSPGSIGVDIAVGDGQSLGNPLNFGGPSLGFISTKKQHIRNLPGRIVGETIDGNGKRGFVLTLQAREQHIKRQKATSNICSNESLCALRAIIYLSAIGKQGFHSLAMQNYDKAEYAKAVLSDIKGVSIWNQNPTFNEFTLELPKNADEIVQKLVKKGFAGGLPLGKYNKNMENKLLIAVTEKRTKEDILALEESLKEALWN